LVFQSTKESLHPIERSSLHQRGVDYVRRIPVTVVLTDWVRSSSVCHLFDTLPDLLVDQGRRAWGWAAKSPGKFDRRERRRGCDVPIVVL
jgi:hypothetical protein